MRLDFCALCGDREHLHQHHVVPRIEGGGDEPENLLTLCAACHYRVHGYFGARVRVSRLQRLGRVAREAEGIVYAPGGRPQRWTPEQRQEIGGYLLDHPDILQDEIRTAFGGMSRDTAYRLANEEAARRGMAARPHRGRAHMRAKRGSVCAESE